eukprot:Colp12_sorted_trinity150504_noHs@10610
MSSTDHGMVAMLLTLMAGLATGLGGVVVILTGKSSIKSLGPMLSFAAGVMLYISFVDLMTDAMADLGFVYANFWFFLGMLIFALCTKLIPEPAPIMSMSPRGKPHPKFGDKDPNLVTTGILTAIGISLHNFPEGMAVYLGCSKGMRVGLPLALAIAIHNIPEDMAVAAPVYHSTGSRLEALKWSTLSGLCEPLGAVVCGVLLVNLFPETVIQSMLASVAGIMIYMCIAELIPTALNYSPKEKCATWIVAGMMAIFVSMAAVNAIMEE